MLETNEIFLIIDFVRCLYKKSHIFLCYQTNYLFFCLERALTVLSFFYILINKQLMEASIQCQIGTQSFKKKV